MSLWSPSPSLSVRGLSRHVDDRISPTTNVNMSQSRSSNHASMTAPGTWGRIKAPLQCPAPRLSQSLSVGRCRVGRRGVDRGHRLPDQLHERVLERGLWQSTVSEVHERQAHLKRRRRDQVAVEFGEGGR